ncbi:MAG: extracellular solute-binding protein [Planctomycetes bacterium]|nr:extracellular solute-binding protein [Planctomycetota bacterium]
MSVVALALAGCSRSPSSPESLSSESRQSGRASRLGQVVVYSSVDQVFAEPICQQFEQDTGITVQLVPDTEETKSTGLVNRLIAEQRRPRADVFWSGDPVRAAILKSKGVSTPYRSPAAEGLPMQCSDAEGNWICFSARARVIIYNKNLVAEDQKPTSVHDLAAPRFKGKACLANPLFGTTSMHAAGLFQVLGDEQARKFFQSLIGNEAKILSSNGEVRRRVANGEFAIGLTDTDDVNVAIQEGKPVGFVFPDAEGMGTLIVPNAAVLIAGGPHAENGKKFVDYLLRPQTEAALARSEAAQMPLRSDTPLPDVFPFKPVSQIRAMSVDYGTLANKLEELSGGFLKQWVDTNL